MSFKNTLVLICLIVLFAGVLVFVQYRNREVDEPLPPNVWSVNEDHITGIDIRLPGQGKQIGFIKKANDKWYIDDEKGFEVDPKRWGGIVLLLSGPRSRRMIVEKADDLTAFGLKNPGMILTLKVTGRKSDLVILIGDYTHDKGSVYVKLQGMEPIYLLEEITHRVLLPLVTKPPKYIPRKGFTDK